MDELERERIRHHLIRAESKLRAAHLLTEAGEFDDAISRAYYAAFHAAQAALVALGHNARTHEAVVTLFGLYLVETGKIERRLGRALHRLRGDRESSDYGLTTFFGTEDAVSAAASASELLDAVRGWLAGELPGELG